MCVWGVCRARACVSPVGVSVCVSLLARGGVRVRSCALPLPLGRRLNGVNARRLYTSYTHELLSLRAVSSSSSARSPKASIACSRGISGAWP